ncbi:MAG: hypothetical protein JXB50_14075, partial [Spirochaetes bacterium]|nr:hypothetical protein [Spirochaetota bacterium]
MNKKNLLLIVTLFLLMCIIWNCAMPTGDVSKKKPGGGSGIIIPVGPENPTESDIVQLNRHLTNNLLYGKKILKDVIEAYPEILEFYGEAKKQHILNVLNVSMSTSVGNESVNNAFNYNNFNLLSNTYLYS